MLQGPVLPLSVLPDQHTVNVVVPGGDSLDGLTLDYTGEQVKLYSGRRGRAVYLLVVNTSV